MHPIQRKVLELAERQNIGRLRLREIGSMVGEPHPQKIKHHIMQLQRKGMLWVDKEHKITKTLPALSGRSSFLAVPIMGTANCGEALHLAENHIEGFLRLSRSMFFRKKGIYALKAVGLSMNQVKVGSAGQSIEDGDYVLVDGEEKNPRDGDCVVSIIEGAANIKKFFRDARNQQIVLLSESSEEYPPTHIHYEDYQPDYMIGGKVVRVIKRPKR